MIKTLRAAERAAHDETTRLRKRDALRASLGLLRPMLDARNEMMSAGDLRPDPMHGDVVLAPGEYDPGTVLPSAIEVRTPRGLAFRLGIAQHDAVLKLEWLLTAEMHPKRYRLVDRIDLTPDGDAVLSYGDRAVLLSCGDRDFGFAYLLDKVEAHTLG
jgi:hypothetical protein